MDGWKKAFSWHIPGHTRSFQAVGADVSFLFVCTFVISGFSWMRRLVSWTSVLSFFFPYSLSGVLFLDLFIYFPIKLSELIKASPSLWFGPCRLFFLYLFIYFPMKLSELN
jgi:hypothetical protein